jgi:hypothetical protein
MTKNTKLTEEEVENIIYLFKTRKKSSGLIKYLEVYRFNKELVEQGKFHITMGEDFWRKENRLGRIMIDKANQIYSNNITTSEKKDITIPNVTDVVNKFHGKKEQLISYLIPLERQIYKSITRENNLKEKLDIVKGELVDKNKKITDLQTRVALIEDTLFKMLRYSNDKDIPIKDQLRMGKDKSKRVEKALEELFDTPIDFYTWYEDKKIKEQYISDNIINIRKNTTLADEYKDIF